VRTDRNAHPEPDRIADPAACDPDAQPVTDVYTGRRNDDVVHRHRCWADT
jgi:hypothetical protein